MKFEEEIIHTFFAARVDLDKDVEGCSSRRLSNSFVNEIGFFGAICLIKSIINGLLVRSSKEN